MVSSLWSIAQYDNVTCYFLFLFLFILTLIYAPSIHLNLPYLNRCNTFWFLILLIPTNFDSTSDLDIISFLQNFSQSFSQKMCIQNIHASKKRIIIRYNIWHKLSILRIN
jgi:hypothetical protein